MKVIATIALALCLAGCAGVSADAYRQECLVRFDSQQFVADLGANARVVALLCVEQEAAACHRSLLADKLAHDLNTPVRHLMPDNHA